MKELFDFRKSYDKLILDELGISPDPINQFSNWFNELDNTAIDFEKNAMTVSTIDSGGVIRNRVVLLKSYGTEGFVFFTNFNSNKGKSLEFNNTICASFYWHNLERQVIIRGKAFKIDEKLAEEYFSSRPKESQIAALASNQSQVISNRIELEEKFKSLLIEYDAKKIEKPTNWGGYIIKPLEIEFWQGRPNRLHDRINYVKENNSWKIERLSP